MTARRLWTEPAPGFFQLTVAHTNCFLIASDDGLLMIDAGLPATRRPLTSLLDHLGARAADIDAIALTHGHFDHVATARSLRAAGAAIHVHASDAGLARHPYSYRPATPRLPYLLSHPRGLAVVAGMAAAGALAVRGVEADHTVVPGRPLDAPGAPVAVWTPGHTDGHCGFFFEREGILLAGDAIVTLDPYTGERGPRIVAPAATSDPRRALESLAAVAATEAATVLTGHGSPWRSGARAAADLARRAAG